VQCDEQKGQERTNGEDEAIGNTNVCKQAFTALQRLRSGSSSFCCGPLTFQVVTHGVLKFDRLFHTLTTLLILKPGQQPDCFDCDHGYYLNRALHSNSCRRRGSFDVHRWRELYHKFAQEIRPGEPLAGRLSRKVLLVAGWVTIVVMALAAAPSSAEADGIDLEGKSIETEYLPGGLSIKYVDGKAMVRVYLLDNTFSTLLIPKGTTVEVGFPESLKQAVHCHSTVC
jgi:hypothetical protein